MEDAMVREPIEEGFEVFTSDREKAFGAVRRVLPRGRRALVIYVENAGDFTVPLDAVADVHSGKVILNRAKLGLRLREAIGHAHDAEDPSLS
jgi:hypothetical protein